MGKIIYTEHIKYEKHRKKDRFGYTKYGKFACPYLSVRDHLDDIPEIQDYHYETDIPNEFSGEVFCIDNHTEYDVLIGIDIEDANKPDSWRKLWVPAKKTIIRIEYDLYHSKWKTVDLELAETIRTMGAFSIENIDEKYMDCIVYILENRE